MCRNHRSFFSSAAQVLLARHSPGRWHTAVGASLAVIAVASGAAAAEPAASEPARENSVSFFGELRLLGGGAAVGWKSSDTPVVDQQAATLGLGLRVGWPLGSQVHLGATASVARYSLVGELEVRDEELFNDPYWLRETSYTLWALPGPFLEIYPIKDEGLFFGLTTSLGWMPANSNLPPNTSDKGLLLAGYALEAGYEFAPAQTHGPGVFLRYAGWTGMQSPLYTDFPDRVNSRELTLGLRWTLRVLDD
jgi:hypothetical protein